MAQMVKNLPTKQEIHVRSLGQEDSLEKGMATHSSILAWSIAWTEEPDGLQTMGSQRVRHNRVTNTERWAHLQSGSEAADLLETEVIWGPSEVHQEDVGSGQRPRGD